MTPGDGGVLVGFGLVAATALFCGTLCRIRDLYSQNRTLESAVRTEQLKTLSAEGALMVLTASLAREDELADLDRQMHLHATHLDVVEARIDKLASGVKEDMEELRFHTQRNDDSLSASIASLKVKISALKSSSMPGRKSAK